MLSAILVSSSESASSREDGDEQPLVHQGFSYIVDVGYGILGSLEPCRSLRYYPAVSLLLNVLLSNLNKSI